MIDFFDIDKYRENNRIEAKKALGGLPHSIWETYSAFANTIGGVILLGVEEHPDKSLHPVCLPDPEMLIEDFWNIMNDGKTVSVNILSDSDVRIEMAEGKKIVAITVPRADRRLRPVYVDGSPFNGSYYRNGEGDCRCTHDMVLSMLGDAGDECGRPLTERDIYGRMIFTYLTKHCYAETEQIAEHLGVDVEFAMELLQAMVETGITETDDLGRYKMKD